MLCNADIYTCSATLTMYNGLNGLLSTKINKSSNT